MNDQNVLEQSTTFISNDSDIQQWATFWLGNELFGVDVVQVMEVLRYCEITPVPGAPHSVVGIINLRGNVVTVIDTLQRFGVGKIEPTGSTRIVVVEHGDVQAGLLVDCMDDVMYIDSEHIEAPPNVSDESRGRFFSGVCQANDNLLIMVQLEEVLSFDV